MREAAPVKSMRSLDKYSHIHAWIVGPLVTFVVFIKVIEFWNRFLLLDKFVAIVLLSSLFLWPLLYALYERKGKKIARTEIVFTGYVVLFLAIELFTLHQ